MFQVKNSDPLFTPFSTPPPPPHDVIFGVKLIFFRKMNIAIEFPIKKCVSVTNITVLLDAVVKLQAFHLASS